MKNQKDFKLTLALICSTILFASCAPNKDHKLSAQMGGGSGASTGARPTPAASTATNQTNPQSQAPQGDQVDILSETHKDPAALGQNSNIGSNNQSDSSGNVSQLNEERVDPLSPNSRGNFLGDNLSNESSKTAQGDQASNSLDSNVASDSSSKSSPLPMSGSLNDPKNLSTNPDVSGSVVPHTHTSSNMDENMNGDKSGTPGQLPPPVVTKISTGPASSNGASGALVVGLPSAPVTTIATNPTGPHTLQRNLLAPENTDSNYPPTSGRSSRPQSSFSTRPPPYDLPSSSGANSQFSGTNIADNRNVGPDPLSLPATVGKLGEDRKSTVKNTNDSNNHTVNQKSGHQEAPQGQASSSRRESQSNDSSKIGDDNPKGEFNPLSRQRSNSTPKGSDTNSKPGKPPLYLPNHSQAPETVSNNDLKASKEPSPKVIPEQNPKGKPTDKNQGMNRNTEKPEQKPEQKSEQKPGQTPEDGSTEIKNPKAPSDSPSGNFVKANTTIYNFPTVKENDSSCSSHKKVFAQSTNPKYKSRTLSLCTKDYKNCLMEGTCFVQTKSGSLTLNYSSGGKFVIVDTDICPFGYGTSQVCLDPYYTVASDQRFHKTGEVIFIRELYHQPMPNGKLHPGYFIVRDTGGRIKGANRFDVYIGKNSYRTTPIAAFHNLVLKNNLHYAVMSGKNSDLAKQFKASRSFPFVPETYKKRPPGTDSSGAQSAGHDKLGNKDTKDLNRSSGTVDDPPQESSDLGVPQVDTETPVDEDATDSDFEDLPDNPEVEK